MSGGISAVSAAGAAAAAAGASTAGIAGAALAANLGTISLISTMASAMGTIAQGNANRANLTNQAAQLSQQAGQTRASSQRDAANKLRTGEYAVSRAAAVTGASGANPDSVTAVTNETNLSGQSEYGALTAMFNGEEKARGLQYEANSDIMKGQSAHDAGAISGVGNVSLAAGSMYGKTLVGQNSDTMLSRYADQYGDTSSLYSTSV